MGHCGCGWCYWHIHFPSIHCWRSNIGVCWPIQNSTMIHTECANSQHPKGHLSRVRFRPSAWFVTLRERPSGWAPRARAASPLRPPSPRATDLNCRVEWRKVTGESMIHLSGWPCSDLQEVQEWGAKMFGRQIQKHQDLNYIWMNIFRKHRCRMNHQPSGSLKITQKAKVQHALTLVPFWISGSSNIHPDLPMLNLREEPWSCAGNCHLHEPGPLMNLILWDSYPTHQHFSSFQAILWLAMAVAC